MRNISLEIEKAGYSGEFYFKATLDMVIYEETGQILTGDIQVIVK